MNNLDIDFKEQLERGARIKYIREVELKMNKTQLANKIGVSSQFLGLVESGRGNLVYRSLKKLMILSGHSADYILFGLDDSIINDTKKCLEQYGYNKFVNALDVIKDISSFINNL